jgi:hypothetical protein
LLTGSGAESAKKMTGKNTGQKEETETEETKTEE